MRPKAIVLYDDHGQPLAVTREPYSEITAAELLTKDLPPMEFYPVLGVDGYFVKGWSHLFAAYPRNGKTEFLSAIVEDWGRRGIKTLWITEESERVWFDRLQRRSLGENCTLVFGLGEKPERLRYRAVTGDHDIVIFDTIRNLLQLHNENDNSEVAHVMNPYVVDARTHGKTPIFVHHNRKTRDGDVNGSSNKIAGGHALMGAVDIALVMDNDPHGNRYRRVIRPWTRVIDSPDLIQQLDPSTGQFTVVHAEAVQQPAVVEKVRTVLSTEWMAQNEIAMRLPLPRPSDEQMRQALLELANNSMAERDPPVGESAQGKRVQWRRFIPNANLAGLPVAVGQPH